MFERHWLCEISSLILDISYFLVIDNSIFLVTYMLVID